MRYDLGFAAIVTLLCPLGHAQGQERATYEYELGSVLDGHVEGSLEATVYFFPTGPGAFTVTSGGGTLTRYVTEFNYTVLRPENPNPHAYEVTRSQTNESFSIGAGTVDVAWPTDGTARIFAWPGPLAPGLSTFDATFDSKGFRTEPFLAKVPGHYYVRWPSNAVDAAMGHDILTVIGGVAGWNRFIHVNTGTVRLTGDFAIYLEEATVTVGHQVIGLPPRNENVTYAPPNAVANYRTQRVHHAFLELSNATLEVPASQAPILVQGFSARAQGTLIASKATGTVENAAGNVSFENRELTLVGSFQWAEEAPYWQAAAAPARAEQTGNFRAVGLDHEPVYARNVPSPIVEIGLWAALAAAVAGLVYAVTKFLGGLFSRFKPDEDDQPSRRRILQALQENPGLSMRALARTLGMTEGHARYHLAYLEAQAVLASRRVGRERRFWVGATPRAKELPLEYDAALRAIAKAVANGDTLLRTVVRRVREEAALSQSAAFKAVDRAQKLGYVKRIRTAKGVWLSCA